MIIVGVGRYRACCSWVDWLSRKETLKGYKRLVPRREVIAATNALFHAAKS